MRRRRRRQMGMERHDSGTTLGAQLSGRSGGRTHLIFCFFTICLHLFTSSARM